MTAEDIIREIKQRIKTLKEEHESQPLKEEHESQHNSDIENAEKAIRIFRSISSNLGSARSAASSIASLAASIKDPSLRDLVKKLENEANMRARPRKSHERGFER